MSRRQHNWLRFGAVALIVGLQLLPRAPRGQSSLATAGATSLAPHGTSLHRSFIPSATISPPPPAAVAAVASELAIAE